MRARLKEEGRRGNCGLPARRSSSRRTRGVRVAIAYCNRCIIRSAADALTVLEELKAQGVGLHLIDLGGDVTGNGISKMVFTILAAVAEGDPRPSPASSAGPGAPVAGSPASRRSQAAPAAVRPVRPTKPG